MIYVITLSFVVVLLVSITVYKFTQVKDADRFHGCRPEAELAGPRFHVIVFLDRRRQPSRRL